MRRRGDNNREGGAESVGSVSEDANARSPSEARRHDKGNQTKTRAASDGPAPGDEDVHGWLVKYVVRGVRLDLADDVHPSDDFAEHDVSPVAPRRRHSRDEKLDNQRRHHRTMTRGGAQSGVTSQA